MERDQGYYQDFGAPPSPDKPRRNRASDKYTGRPHCDMCGAFRGRYLRRLPMSDGEWRCRGCDNED